MARGRKPIPKTQKEISNSLVTPFDQRQGNPNNAEPAKNNRALQTSWKGDTTKPFTVGLQDIDEAIFYYFENIIKPVVTQNGERLTVPVLYASPEKWKSYQKDGYLRDLKGSLMAPLIIFKRESIDKNRAIANKLDANNPHNYAITPKRYSAGKAYSNFDVLNNRKPANEYYAVVVPDYITATYTFVIFTYYVEQLNKVVEAIQYASDSYWGNPERFKFRAMIDSFGFQTQLNETSERIVRSTFTVKLNGYLIPETVQKSTTAINKYFGKARLDFTLEGVDSAGGPGTGAPVLFTQQAPPPVYQSQPVAAVVGTPGAVAGTTPITFSDIPAPIPVTAPTASIPPTPPPTGSLYDVDYEAVLTYATTQGYTLPGLAQRALQSQLIQTLKTGSIWSQLDLFYIFATDGDSNFATLNWRNPSQYRAVPVNNPNFAVNTGFIGDGATTYLNPGWNATLGVNYTQASASHGVYTNEVGYSNGLINVDTGYHGGGSGGVFSIINTYITSPGGSKFEGFYINSPANNYLPSNLKLRAVTYANGNITPYYNATAQTPTTLFSSTPSSSPIYIMARGVPAPQWFANSLVEFKADFWGGYLDSTQIGILYAALNTYTAAI
jgi:hypothetical protein